MPCTTARTLWGERTGVFMKDIQHPAVGPLLQALQAGRWEVGVEHEPAACQGDQERLPGSAVPAGRQAESSRMQASMPDGHKRGCTKSVIISLPLTAS
jgi:hypothetical protein